MALTEFVAEYGYGAVFLGSILEGETIAALGGVAAHRGYLNLFGVMAVAFAGSWLGDQFYFFLGRRHGNAVLARFPSLQPQALKARHLIEQYRAPLIVAIRFLYGLRTVGPMVIGMTAVPALRFMLLNALGAILWAVVVTAAGYAFSNVVELLLPEIGRSEEYLFLAVLAAGMLFVLLRLLRRRGR
jgi:membrane protein DedA with SNARE-associated domain